MKKRNKAPKGSTAVTVVFYISYFLLIAGYLIGMNFLHGWLTGQLVDFEASVQPGFRGEEVFQELFADPDWSQLYDTAGLTDTKFEGKEAFLEYMTSLVGDNELTYAETAAPSGSYRFEVQLDGQPLGHFTLVNRANANAAVPDWQLGTLSFHLPREQQVIVEKTDGHTVYVNGRLLDDSYTVEIRSTAAEDYLPDGTVGIRRLRQEVTGLLVTPEITILDSNGEPCELVYDEESGIYSETLPAAEAITAELKAQAIAAGEAYCTYMVEQSNYQLLKHFASGTDAYRAITSAAPWPQDALETAITGQTVSNYVRYTDDLFSVRVRMSMVLTYDGLFFQKYPMDSILFFENRKDGWKVIAMTNEDITEETLQVRLTYMYGDTLLSTVFCDSESTELYAPLVTAPPGQIFSGWAEKTAASDGSTGMNLVFTADENGKLHIPQDTILKPMTLYPLFEDAPAVG